MWHFSKKLISSIEHPSCFGTFSEEEAFSKKMRFAKGSSGDLMSGSIITLFLLVDEEDGVIADAKFQVFGPPPLIGAAESACNLLVRKNTMQARRLSADLIDKEMRDKDNAPAFPEVAHSFLNLVLEAIDKAIDQCMDIPIAETYVAPPDMGRGERQEYPNWNELTDAQKQPILEEVIKVDILPYIELDAGGVKVLKVVENCVTIAYSGNCTSCFSATGATLDAIGNHLRMKIHPEIVVIPDMSVLNANH